MKMREYLDNLPERKPLAPPEYFVEYVSAVERKYEQLKASGACPYASLREYIESLLNSDIAEQFKSKKEKGDK